jgi:hypothetical protein
MEELTMEADIYCGKCGCALTHHCYVGAKQALEHLMTFKLEGGSEPFFSEGTLYDLFSKDDARTVLCAVYNFAQAFGVDPFAEKKKPTCLHRYRRELDKLDKRDVMWCETCGALRGEDALWELPVVKQQVRPKKKARKR